MNRTYKNVATVLLLATLISCSNMAPIENINSSPIPVGTHTLSNAEIGSVIAKAAIDRGWTVTLTGSNKIHATLNAHGAEAEVNILYSATSYSILYASSRNYDQEGVSISSAYNRYIDYLNLSISKNLNAAVF